jgi:hypothetical protein
VVPKYKWFLYWKIGLQNELRAELFFMLRKYYMLRTANKIQSRGKLLDIVILNSHLNIGLIKIKYTWPA